MMAWKILPAGGWLIPKTPKTRQAFFIKQHEHPPMVAYFKAWRERKIKYTYALQGKIKQDWDDFLFSETELKNLPAFVIEGMKAPDLVYLNASFNNFGNLTLASLEPLSDEHFDILLRFAKVFDLTYTRFNDLQQAEAQARESQIQLALERVRARTMAMQRSDELSETSFLLFQQFRELGSDASQISIGIINEKENLMEMSATIDGSKMDHVIHVSLDEPVVMKKLVAAWKEQKRSLVIDISGDELQAYNDYRNSIGTVKFETKEGDHWVVHIAFFSKGIISFSSHERHTADTIGLLERFAAVFDLTYTRFLDLKQAEAQTKEAKIEAALERVRSRTMAMHQPSELQEVIHTVHKELLNLDLSIVGGSFVVINDDVENELRCWGSGGTANTSQEVKVPHFNMPFCTNLISGIKSGPGFFTEVFSPTEKKEYFTELFKQQPWSDLSSEQKNETLTSLGGYTRSVAVSKYTSIFIINHHGRKFTADENDILKRFAKVFEQSYTRFLDLKKAESQAREAQIELALERVRARTMAMHRSEELAETAQVMFHQLQELGEIPDRISIGVVDEVKGVVNFWTTDQSGSHINNSFAARLNERTVIEKTYRAWKENEKSLVIDLRGDELKEWIRFAREEMNIVVMDDQIKDRRVHTLAYFSHGWILVTTHEPQKAETIQILERFASVFNLTYRRFLDLQKAEAQAREAQIESTLEKVRSRSLAMHKSEELQEVVNTVFERLQDLNIEMDSCNIAIFKEGTRDYDYWIASPFQKRTASFYMPYVDLSLTRDLIAARERGAEFSSTSYSFEEKNEWFDYAFKQTDFKFLTEERKQFILNAPSITVAIAFSKHTGVQVNRYSDKLLSEGEADILKRFSKVFEQAYIRFLDLQKAEAQAREAQIEASLERVRAKTMAMQHSNELDGVIKTVYAELKKLDVAFARCFIMIFDEHNGATWWMGSPDDDLFHEGFYVQYHSHPPHLAYLKGWQERQQKWEYRLEGPVKNDWDEFVFNKTELAKLPPIVIQDMRSYEFANLSASFENFGCLTTGGLEWLTEESFTILSRFAKVFDLSYTRFKDLQKAEAQARESQIEVSLERVRSSSLAMHKSDELKDVVKIVLENFRSLGLENIDSVNINIFHEGSRDFDLWLAAPGQDYTTNFHLPYLDHPIANDFFNAVKKRETIHKGIYDHDLKNKYFEYMFEYSDNKHLPEERKELILNGRAYSVATGIAKHSSIFIHNYNGELFSEETDGILVRFSKVFDQAYTRFLDLQKAEAQAREAQIEASLERVRSKTMAMHNSADLSDTSSVLFNELKNLGIDTIRSGFGIMDHKTETSELWLTTISNKKIETKVLGTLPASAHVACTGFYNAWKNREASFKYELKADEVKNYYEAISRHISMPSRETFNQEEYINCFFFPEGSLNVITLKSLAEEEHNIMLRFARVFGLLYRRFLDLQKAEANAREAQIEAGLERVRARTMAMHSSEDVSMATATMFTELEKLGIENLRGGITIIQPDQTQEVWSITNLPDGKTIRAIGVFDMRLHPLWRALFKAKDNKEDYDYYWLAGKEKEDYIAILNETPNYLAQPIKEIPDVHVQSYFFGEGGVWTNSLQPHSEEDKQIMKRFTSVFSLTFRRYQDLKNAEAQAKEATIEAALEKVRGKAMAMHNSNDLSVTTSMIISELRKLGISPIRCGVGIIDRQTHKGQLYTATTSPDGDSLSIVGWVLLKGHPVLENIYEKFVQGEDYFPELTGDSMRAYYEQLLAGLSVPLPDFKDEQIHYGHFFAVSVGCLYTWSDIRYNEDEIKILKRFASIIDLTFRRYFELQKSEANAREAVKQAALDRVRADIASMRSISDLDRITPLIWNELKTLSIPFIRCGVFIMDEDQQLTHTFLSTPDGKAIAAFHLPYDTPGNVSKVIDGWRHKKIYVDHWGEEEFTQFADILMKEGALTSREQYLKSIPHGGFYLHFLPFLQGMLYVGNTKQLKQEEIELIQHVADAFSTAYARYEDFNRLEAAKQQVEKTLTDLKQAQTQLVQSEKMASLGEMTAGIAHEIQNPLNFVNNFSEVSKELLDEMKTELETGNTEDAKDIADDVIQNLEKINHHGKRADAIVKSMLQHSRSSSGKKEPADINGLADEYLRLAYHGLRAKDKSFNAKFETEFDNSIGKINIISQDIGRVLVNLINNAFYAVSERKKQESNGYEPTVTVYTKKIDDKIEIKVKDNGNGIPQKVLDKIFQPFFTTKPTGQGTGLGLSLAYDIVTKGHSGELKVETKEGEGSEFIIQLPVSKTSEP
jgi:signal transduction histidine kinase